MNKMEQGELISALIDGEVQEGALAQALQAMQSDPQLQSTWDTYHLVGDVLRAPDLAAGASSAAVLARLRPALALAAIHAAQGADAGQAAVAPDLRRRTPAANDGRWKIVAGLASVAAVLAVGWNVAGLGLGGTQSPQLAGVPGQPAVVASGERQPMLRDARLDELLAAHRQFGSATAIQMPAGALRNAAFETPAR